MSRRFRPELSAQRLSHTPNPMVTAAIAYLTNANHRGDLGTVADVGCGKLRHFNLLRQAANELVLVDTRAQLEAEHVDGNLRYTINTFVARRRGHLRRLRVIPADQFEATRLDLDVAFSIAVFDVVPSHIRARILRSIVRNLRPHGWFVLVIPRNDTTILRRCNEDNQRWDGHWFPNRDGYTFYRNFRRTKELLTWVTGYGFTVKADLSRYRQICLAFRRDPDRR